MNKQSKQRIKDLELQTLKAKHPTIDERFIPLTAWNDNTANGLTKCIVSFINMSGGYAERINTTGIYQAAKTVKDLDGISRTIGKGKWRKSGSTNGSADVSSTIPLVINNIEVGVSVKWEVKIGKDRQSDAQKEYENNTKIAGGYYFIVKNFDEFLSKYDELLNTFS
jgi:hypothetical protein